MVTHTKSTETSYDLFCLNYEGIGQVKESKVNSLIKKYEMFKMEERENLDTMFSRFQVLIFGLKVLNKIYTTTYH